MVTINQLVKHNVRQPKKYRTKAPALDACPQRSGTVTLVKTVTPKKPNSALRKICRK